MSDFSPLGEFALESAYKYFLMHISPLFYGIIFISLAVLFTLNFKSISKRFSKIDRKVYAILILIFLAGFWLRLSNIYWPASWDVSIWEHVQGGKFLGLKGILQRCDYGSFNECAEPTIMAHPAGFSFILGTTFFLFGANMNYVMLLQLTAGSLTILVLFFLAYILTKNKEVSLLSSAFLAFSPLHLINSISWNASLSAISVFFTSLYFLFLVHAIKDESKKSYALAAICFATLLTFRMENVLYIFVSLLLYFHLRGFEKKTLKAIWDDISRNKFSLLLAFLLALVPFSVFLEHWVFGGLIASSFMPANLLQNIDFFLQIMSIFFVPLIFLFMAYVPVLLHSKKHRSLSVTVLVWFLISPLMFLFFIYGTSDRYIMPTCIPFALFLGLGTAYTAENLRKFRPFVFLGIAIVLLLTVQSIPFGLLERDKISEPLHLIGTTEPGSKVIIPKSNTVWAIQCFDSDMFLVPFMNLGKLQDEKHLYFLYTITCDSELFPEYREHCEYLKDAGTLVGERGKNKLFHIGSLSPQQMQDLLDIFEKYKSVM